MYCFEQADQPAGLSVEDLALQAGDLADKPGTLTGVGRTVTVESSAVQLPPVAADGMPYSGQGGDTSGRQAAAVAVPYFQWDNRDGRAMRVWMPLSEARQPDSGRGRQ